MMLPIGVINITDSPHRFRRKGHVHYAVDRPPYTLSIIFTGIFEAGGLPDKGGGFDLPIYDFHSMSEYQFRAVSRS